MPQSGVLTAREVLLQADLGPVLAGGDRRDAPWRVAAALVAGLVLLALIAWAGTELLG